MADRFIEEIAADADDCRRRLESFRAGRDAALLPRIMKDYDRMLSAVRILASEVDGLENRKVPWTVAHEFTTSKREAGEPGPYAVVVVPPSVANNLALLLQLIGSKES